MEEYGSHAINQLGQYGKQIIGGASLLILLKIGNATALGYYSLGSLICILTNIILKILIKQPRPKDDQANFNFLIQHNKRIPYDKFGMPSGHAQFMVYTLVFMSYATRGYKYYWWLMSFFTLLTINTIIQRVRYDYHTVNQVLVGSLIGILFGVGTYYVTKSKLRGKMSAKEDDNALFIA
jgi:membrane-associated phospholipid phosphatase